MSSRGDKQAVDDRTERTDLELDHGQGQSSGSAGRPWWPRPSTTPTTRAVLRAGRCRGPSGGRPPCRVQVLARSGAKKLSGGTPQRLAHRDPGPHPAPAIVARLRHGGSSTAELPEDLHRQRYVPGGVATDRRPGRCGYGSSVALGETLSVPNGSVDVGSVVIELLRSSSTGSTNAPSRRRRRALDPPLIRTIASLVAVSAAS